MILIASCCSVLQHDFGLYIVNLFDTSQAARVLAYPSASLAHLLEHHVGFSADKRYQLADWRLRPLPEDMLLYARADTHFLLYVAERLKDELRALGDRVPPSWAQDLPPHSGATVSGQGCRGGHLGCGSDREVGGGFEVKERAGVVQGAAAALSTL